MYTSFKNHLLDSHLRLMKGNEKHWSSIGSFALLRRDATRHRVCVTVKCHILYVNYLNTWISLLTPPPHTNDYDGGDDDDDDNNGNRVQKPRRWRPFRCRARLVQLINCRCRRWLNVRAAVRIALPDVVVSRQTPVTTTTRHVPLARTLTANLNDSSYLLNPIYEKGRQTKRKRGSAVREWKWMAEWVRNWLRKWVTGIV